MELSFFIFFFFYLGLTHLMFTLNLKHECLDAMLLPQSYYYPNLSEDIDSFGWQLCGDRVPLRWHNQFWQSLEEGAWKLCLECGVRNKVKKEVWCGGGGSSPTSPGIMLYNQCKCLTITIKRANFTYVKVSHATSESQNSYIICGKLLPLCEKICSAQVTRHQ